MTHDTPLTQEQRYQIDAYRKAGLNQTETAEKLRVDKSTITREIRRNRGWRGDRAPPAQKRCLARRAESHGSRIGVSDGQRVETLIRQKASGRSATSGSISISSGTGKPGGPCTGRCAVSDNGASAMAGRSGGDT